MEGAAAFCSAWLSTFGSQSEAYADVGFCEYDVVEREGKGQTRDVRGSTAAAAFVEINTDLDHNVQDESSTGPQLR